MRKNIFNCGSGSKFQSFDLDYLELTVTLFPSYVKKRIQRFYVRYLPKKH